MDMLKIGLTGLTATQYALTVASNNITNASTEGYARQEMVVSPETSINVGGNYFGQGVFVDQVKRVGSDHLEVSLRDSTSSHEFYQKYYDLGVEIDRLLSDQDTGLDKSLQDFFTSVGDLANNPTSEATRSVLIDSLDSLGGKFANIAQVLRASRETTDNDISAFTKRINSLAEDLVEVNDAIAKSVNRSGDISSQLLDKRYSILTEMGKYADITVFEDSNGIASVYMAGSLALVANNTLTPLEARPNGFTEGQYEVYLRGQEISTDIRGGQLGGLIEYRNNVLNASEDEVGRISLAFSQMLNVTHRQGYTPLGVAGGDLVTNFAAVGQTHQANGGTGVLNVSFNTGASVAAQTAAVGQLEARTYDVEFNGATYDVYDVSDGSLILGGAPAGFSIDGLEFNIAGAPVAGDRFRISPAKQAIDNYSVVITDTQDFANSQDPLGSISDNRNSLDIYDLKDGRYLDNGLDSFQGAYSTFVAKLGSKVSTAEASVLTYSSLKDQAQLNRDSESGVNTEEEAAYIINLQQQYSASAKVIQAAQEIFDELLSAIG